MLANFLISFFLSLILINFSRPFLRKYLLVKPNIRSSHLKSKPTGAGIVFVLISAIGFLSPNRIISLLCLPLAIIGFVDDIRGVNFVIRYLIQFLTGIFDTQL